MNNQTVNQRVVKSINYLLEQGIVKKKGDIAEILQCTPQTITEILGGRQGMKVDVLQKFFDKFKVSYKYIFEGIGNILKDDSANAQEYAQKYAQESPVNAPESGKTTSIKSGKDEVRPEPFFVPIGGKTNSTKIVEVPVPVEDDSEMVSIPVVDISVAAGSGCYNTDYLSEVDSIRFPRSMVKGGQPHICVRIKGESMVPTLQDGGYLIIRLLNRPEWQYVHDGHVYVVSDIEGRSFVKRLKNRFKDHGYIVCISDNPDPMGYPDFDLMADEINTIWHAEWYISAQMPNIHASSCYKKVDALEKKYDDLIEEFQQMRQEIKEIGRP